VCPAELGDLAQAAGSSRGNPNITTTTTATSIKHTFGLCFFSSDVNKDWTCKDKDNDKDFTYSYLLQVAAKPTIAIKQQQ